MAALVEVSDTFAVPMKLTEEQLEIIHHHSGHARVAAVAGSGKTTTMVARIGELLQRGVAADRIMVLMFNRSARDLFELSLKTRLSSFPSALPQIRTFHSLGYRLTSSFEKQGVLSPCRLVTHEYAAERLAKEVARDAWRQQEEKSSYLPAEFVEEFLHFIDLVKGSLEDAPVFYRSLKKEKRFDFFVPAFEEFEKQRRRQGIRFYSDLIADPVNVLRDNEKIRQWVTNRIDHVIVDEYQDINEVQEELLRTIAGDRAQVMVVGDVDQCIYEWRGAKPVYINRNFAKDFPDPVNYHLSFTFRYGHVLSLAANHLIANNFQRDETFCLSFPGNCTTRVYCMEESREQHPVPEIILSWLKRGRKLNEAVVLVRLYAQSVPVELALLSADIPYRMEGGDDLFACEEILALLGYLRLADQSFSEIEPEKQKEMLSAMLAQPHLGIKGEEITLLAEKLLPFLSSDVSRAIGLLGEGIDRELPSFIREHFTKAEKNWRWLVEQGAESNAATLLSKLVDRLELYEFYTSFSVRLEAAENRIKTCEALISFARGRGLNVRQLIDHLETFRSGRRCNEDSLLITSVHRAKGLEWPLVILPGLEDGSFPFFRKGGEDESDFEDERRLFYVAITRAIEELVCLHPSDIEFGKSKIPLGGTLPRKQIRASRFLYESRLDLCTEVGKALGSGKSCEISAREDLLIARSYLEKIGRNDIRLKGVSPRDLPNDTVATRPLVADELTAGLVVRHPDFGDGVITAVRDRKNGRITVDFSSRGETLLLAGKVKLEVVE